MQASSHSPHPLTKALIDRLRARRGAAVLEIGSGSGRNTRALASAGLRVYAPEDAPAEPCAAALATHALLHGTPQSIAAQLAAIARRLEPGAPLYATFGCVRDARYGEGERLEEFVYAPVDGDERGVAHAFFDQPRLRALLCGEWAVESIEERVVDDVAGRWAHRERPLAGAVHWFVVALRQ
jgi:hypothetical protein